MKKELLTHIIMMFVVVVGSNVLIEWAEEGNINKLLEKPLLFFGIGVIGSIVGGYFIYWIDQRSKKKKEEASNK